MPLTESALAIVGPALEPATEPAREPGPEPENEVTATPPAVPQGLESSNVTGCSAGMPGPAA